MSVPPTSDDPAGAAPLSSAADAGLRRLRSLLAEVRRRTRGWVWIDSLALVGVTLALVFWGSMAFDWAVEPPVWVRACIGLGALAGVAWILRERLVSRLATPLGDSALATLVERGHPDFRDSLSTAVELAAEPRAGVDRALLERTILEAAAVADRVDPETLFRRRRLFAAAALGATALLTVAATVVARPSLAGVWTRRMIFLDDAPWPRRTVLEAEGFVDGVRTVARGSDVDLVVTADAARDVPEVVDVRVRPARGGAWRVERMGLRGGVEAGRQAFGHVIKGVTEDVELEIRGGDARLRGLRLAAVDAPTLERLECIATLPEYLGSAERAVAASRVLQVPRGSMLDIVFHATKPLAAAVVSSPAADPGGADVTIAALDHGAVPPPRSIAARLGPVEGERTVVARFTDTDGLVNREPIALVVIAVPDEPPRVAVRMRGISTAVTPQASVPLVGTVSDDHGIASAAVTVAVKDGATTVLPVERVRVGSALVEFTDDAPESVAIESLALAPGASLSLRLGARDGCTLVGGPNEGASDAWSLDVVTPEALMAMLEAREILLRRRFESVVSDLALSRERVAVERGPAEDRPPAGEDADEGDEASGAADGFALEVARLAESAARAAGETAEIAEAFRAIRLEVDNNRMLTEELENRLVGQIAVPLAGIATTDLPGLSTQARAAGAGDREPLLTRTDAVLARMRAVLDKMMELESYNEVVELLRDVIRTQEEIRTETLRRQRQRAKEALERP